MFVPYELQKMGGERAIRILESILADLSIMEVEDLTTFELGILHQCAVNPPEKKRGVESSVCG